MPIAEEQEAVAAPAMMRPQMYEMTLTTMSHQGSLTFNLAFSACSGSARIFSICCLVSFTFILCCFGFVRGLESNQLPRVGHVLIQPLNYPACVGACCRGLVASWSRLGGGFVTFLGAKVIAFGSAGGQMRGILRMFNNYKPPDLALK